MEALVGALIGIMIVQGGALWYKVGTVERGLKDLKEIILNGGKKKEGKDNG